MTSWVACCCGGSREGGAGSNAYGFRVHLRVNSSIAVVLQYSQIMCHVFLFWRRQTLHVGNDDIACDSRVLSCTSLVRVHVYPLQAALFAEFRWGVFISPPYSNSIPQRNTIPAKAVVRAKSYTIDICVR